MRGTEYKHVYALRNKDTGNYLLTYWASSQKQLLMVPALTFATEVVKAKPNMTAAGVAEYVATVITKLRQVL